MFVESENVVPPRSYPRINQTFSDRSAHSEGELDGAIELPNGDEPCVPPQIRLIAAVVGEIIQEVGKRFLSTDAVLYPRQKSRQEKLNRLSTTAETQPRAPASEPHVARRDLPALGPLAFWLMAIALVILDFPLMLTVFEGMGIDELSAREVKPFIGKAEMLAVGVQLVLLAAGKLAGILVHKARSGERDGFTTGVVVVIALLVVTACCSLAWFRHELVERDVAARNARIQRANAQADPGDPILPELPEQAEAPSLGTFGSLLLLTFVVGTVLSWLSHDPSRRRARTVPGLWAAWTERHNRVQLARVRAERRRRFERAEADAVEWDMWSLALQEDYWSGNFHERRRPRTLDLEKFPTDPVLIPLAAWRQADYDFD